MSLVTKLRTSPLWKKWLIKKGKIQTFQEIEDFINQAPPVYFEETPLKMPKIGIIKTGHYDRFDGYDTPRASYLRYVRFCQNNTVPYEFYDIEKSNWLDEAKKFDIIICHVQTTPYYKSMIEKKLYIIQELLKIHCFPSFHEVIQYEDKCFSHDLYKLYNLPSIPTVVTNSYEEALQMIDDAKYPFISKTTIGASSSGVELIKSKREAKRLVRRIFSKKGRRTYHPYLNQKNYLYKQEFIDDASYDLRIILVGNRAFGYYRYPHKGDFRASGSGIYEKKEIPLEALQLAIRVKESLGCLQLGVDLLYSPKSRQYYIIETSLFNQIDTPEQLMVNGIAGYYDVSDCEEIKFVSGKYWVQELLMKEVILSWCNELSDV